MKIDTTQYTMIPAYVEQTMPDLTDYKQYRTSLTFDGKVMIEVPVPTAEVTKKGDKYILTLAGWKAFLKNYAKITQELHDEYLRTFQH